MLAQFSLASGWQLLAGSSGRGRLSCLEARASGSEIVETLKIIGVCVLAAAAYGIGHDLITTRVCLEYFTVFHPPILNHTQSPTLLALGWGLIASWWVGLLLGIPRALASRFGNRPKLLVSDLGPWIRTLLLVMASCALLAGVGGFFWGTVPREFEPLLAPEGKSRFAADLWAHNAYASGVIGGVIVCVLAYRRRCFPVRF